LRGTFAVVQQQDVPYDFISRPSLSLFYHFIMRALVRILRMSYRNIEEMMKERGFKISLAKYLNNIVEQDHRHIKRITSPMGEFRKLHTAA